MSKITNNNGIHFNANLRNDLELAECFIKSYIAAREGLTKLGILRSQRTLQVDYAEWLCAKLLGLKLEPNLVQKGYDAKDDLGNTYQIKSRIVKSLYKNTSFDFRDIDLKFDYLLCVFLSPAFDLLAIACVPYKVVQELGTQTTTSFRFRWNKKTAKDSRIKWVFMNKNERNMEQ